ncbi:DMP19 family protein [Kineococcus indalonis]|uniref:DMP19 family protein n=1 Tax=Kineococcus indalonis TaxID=2696566 RepID=UPI001412C70D|nr:hypothetical protein [Kineococcus indalonis]NAZ85477.1 hypothetical protein [Kineococcus indalonis]
MLDDDFDALWNRACRWDSPAVRTHEGDAALHVALTFHGSVVNGGLFDAVQNHREDPEHPLPRVLQAYRFLGLDDVAATVDAARRRHEELAPTPDDEARWGAAEEQVDASCVLDDEGLGAAARAAVRARPHSFAPLG